MEILHINVVLSISISLIARSYSIGFNCPAFWKSYDGNFCYMVLNSKWPVSHDNALHLCRAFSDSTKDGTLLEMLPGMDIERLIIATPNINYWIGPVKFMDNFYNLIHDTGKVQTGGGDGGCSILSMSANESVVIPTMCGIGERPLVCGLYPKKLERSVKRSQLNCGILENTAADCIEWTSEMCEGSTKGCERHCCELITSVESNCVHMENAWSTKTCSFIKETGSCQRHRGKCSLTCCEENQKHMKNKGELCSELSNAKHARFCYDKAFAEKRCREERVRDECAFACCAADHSEVSRRRRFVLTWSTSSAWHDSMFTSHSFSTFSGTDITSEPSTTSVYSECYDSGLENKNGDNFCRDRVLDNPDKCEQDSFIKKCELSCCLIDPSSCFQYEDELSERVCYRRVTLGRCSAAATAEQCKRSCCDAGELETTTSGTKTGSSTATTSDSTIFELCGEYSDTGENCERRVEKRRCTDPLNEVKCQYSCCIDLFKTTTASQSTTEKITTESSSDKGIIECLDYLDTASPEFCAAAMSENDCSVYESQHLCEFSCCMYNFAHDTEDPDFPEVEINENCDDEDDTLYVDCLEAFVLGKCDHTHACIKTCCLWSGAFYGNPCLMFSDESGYEYCTINCFNQCGDDNMCEVLCKRTVCLFCNKPYFWPSSTTEPSGCYGLNNEDSGVDCALKAALGYCTPNDGIYDNQCNFACCVVNVQTVLANHVTEGSSATGCPGDLDCISHSGRSGDDLLVRKKRSELSDREMQIQPSYIFIASVLIIAKLCLYINF